MSATSVVGMIIGLAGALGVGSQLGTWATLRAQRTARLEEREAGRDEQHRNDLRHAYIEFIAALGKMLDLGSLLHWINKAVREQKAEAHAVALEATGDKAVADAIGAKAGNEGLKQKARDVLDQFMASFTEVNTRALAVLFLEDDPGRRALIMPFSNLVVKTPNGPDDHERFMADLRRIRADLDAAITQLTGVFAPGKWHAEVAQRRALPPGAK